MTRTLVVSAETIPTLDDDQMKRAAQAYLFDEHDPETMAYLRTDGVERLYAALHAIVVDIAAQLAAYEAGRFVPKTGDPAMWRKKAGKMKARIEGVLPDVQALRQIQRARVNGGLQTSYRELVEAVEAHRQSRVDWSAAAMAMHQASEPGQADVALWGELDRITAVTPA